MFVWIQECGIWTIMCTEKCHLLTINQFWCDFGVKMFYLYNFLHFRYYICQIHLKNICTIQQIHTLLTSSVCLFWLLFHWNDLFSAASEGQLLLWFHVVLIGVLCHVCLVCLVLCIILHIDLHTCWCHTDRSSHTCCHDQTAWLPGGSL